MPNVLEYHGTTAVCRPPRVSMMCNAVGLAISQGDRSRQVDTRSNFFPMCIYFSRPRPAAARTPPDGGPIQAFRWGVLAAGICQFQKFSFFKLGKYFRFLTWFLQLPQCTNVRWTRRCDFCLIQKRHTSFRR